MTTIQAVLSLVLASSIGGCTTGVFYVSSRPAPDGDGIYRYRASDGSDRALGGVYTSGSSPHIATDGTLLYVKPVAGVRQVFHGAQQLTHSPGDKSFPRWSTNWLAFQQTVGSTRSVVLRRHDGTVEFTLASDVATGLAFFDGGQRVAFARSDGIYWASATQGAAATRIESCPNVTPPASCHLPAVSHDGSLLAYRVNVPTAPGVLEYIRIVNVGSWTPVGNIARTALDSASPGNATTSLGSFAFSPDDQWLYVTANVRTTSGAPASRPDLFRIRRDGTQAGRLLNNTYPNSTPTARRIWLWE